MSSHDNDHVILLGNEIMDPHVATYIYTACDHRVTILGNALVLGHFLDLLVYKAAN